MGRSSSAPRGLVVGVLLMTVVVLALGGVVLVVKLRPPGRPASDVQRDVARWEVAVETDPSDDWAQAGLGLALLEADRADEAQAAFERALQLNGDNWVALHELGVLLLDDDPPRARSLLERASKAAPRTSKASSLLALGDLLLGQGDAEAARGAYRRAIADVPFLADGHVGLAEALEALGDPEGALEQYREAARYDPENPEIAEAIARLGD